ncbi:hypothetical protein BC332_07968 [Capsicum chinense]|nr:hypothetical protein BC332_07968 [Capsicum chinense]
MWEANTPKKKKKKFSNTGVDPGNDNVANTTLGKAAIFEAERFGFELSPEFTLDAFQKYADDFELATI